MYLAGFGNHHATEAIAGALPTNQNSPQQCAFGLYAEQLSGTSFTVPRHKNLHSWLYRRLPSVVHGEYMPYATRISRAYIPIQPPNPFRWSPLALPTQSQDFVDGLFYLAGNDKLHTFIYQCNQSMTRRYLSNQDGEWLFVPYQGRIRLETELGILLIKPGMIAVIPRGIFFKVVLEDALAAGYLCENTGMPLTLPQRGMIGANGLANARHFLYPTAAYENTDQEAQLLCKTEQQWWETSTHHSPLNVVAWHGNYAPYCYDLALFNTLNSVSFDHPDPSLFTVLTSESDTPGTATLDFVIFPPRWVVAEHTFRPPYYHKNIMSELMGLIIGNYDAKKEGFDIGGISIHNRMIPHGPDKESYTIASQQHLKPAYYENTLAFMLESREPWRISEVAFNHPARQVNYVDCWQGLPPANLP